jgi:tripartite-type tricarboxylate transporter receptor subunit TctC
MHRLIRAAAVAALAAAVLPFAPRGAAAQGSAFPARPILLVSQATAGSSMDLMCREVAKLAPKYLHQTVVVEDKVGGDGAVAMQYVLSEPADGYTLAAITRSFATTLNTDLQGKFKPDDFTFISSLISDSYVLAVSADSPYKTLRDLLAAGASAPITVGGFGSQSAEAIFAKRLAYETKAKLVWVPFSGGSAGTAAVLGGHIVATISHPGDAREFVAAGKLRVLGVSSDSALPLFPGAVTFRSLGYPDLTVLHYRGIVGRAGLPPAVTAKLADFFKAVVHDPEFVDYMKQVGVVAYYNDPTAFGNIVRNDVDIVGRQLNAH